MEEYLEFLDFLLLVLGESPDTFLLETKGTDNLPILLMSPCPPFALDGRHGQRKYLKYETVSNDLQIK